MRQLICAVLTLSILAIATWALLGVARHRDATIAAPVQPAEPSPCTVDARKVARPAALLLGETAAVTLAAKIDCSAARDALHVVLVLDASGSMVGDPNREMKAAAKGLVDRLNLRDDPMARVGVVEFSDAARTLCQLTNNAAQAKSCIDRIGADGGTCVDCGIAEGLRVLLQGRRVVQDPEGISEVMVVLTDGGNGAGCDPVLQAARQAKAQGVLLMTVCVGTACDTTCMRSAASSARYFFDVVDGGGLVLAFDRIASDLARTAVRRLTITDTLPVNMALVPGSDMPPAVVSPDGRQLVWAETGFAAAEITLTFKVRPAEPGTWPTNANAAGEFLDHRGRVGRMTFPVPSITVLRPIPNPTPAESPSPGATPVATATSTAVPAETPTSTARPPRWTVYLPAVRREGGDGSWP